jgi:hypothetical protein
MSSRRVMSGCIVGMAAISAFYVGLILGKLTIQHLMACHR